MWKVERQPGLEHALERVEETILPSVTIALDMLIDAARCSR